MSQLLEYHRRLVSYRTAQAAYRRAIRQAVRPGDRVLDLGTGTGIHAFEACGAGASKVYAIERSEISGIAADISRASGLERNIDFIRGMSTFVRLPEKVDVLVAYLGQSDLLRYVPETARRYLKPGGRTIPMGIDMWIVPIRCPSVYKSRVLDWTDRGRIRWGAVRKSAVCTIHPVVLRHAQFASSPKRALSIPLNKAIRSMRCSRQFLAARNTDIHGLGGWYEYHLSRGVSLSMAPSPRIRPDIEQHAFFPLEKPVRVRAGERILVHLNLLIGSDLLWRWSVTHKGQTYSSSNFNSPLLSDEVFRLDRSSRLPSLNMRGRLTLSVLDRCRLGGRFRSLIDHLCRHDPDIFPNRASAETFAIETLSSYATIRSRR